MVSWKGLGNRAAPPRPRVQLQSLQLCAWVLATSWQRFCFLSWARFRVQRSGLGTQGAPVIQFPVAEVVTQGPQMRRGTSMTF